MLPIKLDRAARMLYSMEPLRKPLTQAIISALALPDGSRGLDVGCGIGLQTLLLAGAVGPNGNTFFSPILFSPARRLRGEA